MRCSARGGATRPNASACRKRISCGWCCATVCYDLDRPGAHRRRGAGRSRRVPGTRPRDYLEVLKLRRASAKATVTEVLDPGSPLFRRLWQPLAVAALNTAAADASARLFGRILAETLGRGGAACRALLPREGLSESLIDPALELLRRGGADIRFGARLRGLGFTNGRRTG